MSSAPRMTVRQIASAAGCNHKTVRAAIDKLYPGRAKNGVRLDFSEAEAFEIAAALPKRNFIQAPSRKREGQLPESGKVRLSGALLRELRLSVKAGILIQSDPRRILGLDTATAEAKMLPFPADPFLELRDVLGDKAARQVAAATARIAKDAHAREAADREQGRLL